MNTLSTTPQAQLRQLIDGYRASQAISAAAELGLADLLADGPRHYDNLARADAYILSRVLHDWTDEQAIQILKTTRRSMAGGAALLLVERVLDSQNPSPEATLTDIHMLVMTGGRERTAEEFQVLMAASGFDLVRAVETGSPVHVAEGVAV